jgi:hypothetical protein
MHDKFKLCNEWQALKGWIQTKYIRLTQKMNPLKPDVRVNNVQKFTEKHCVSITKTNPITPFWETIADYYENHRKYNL